jgi:membrane-associated phospholipid phosphatase
LLIIREMENQLAKPVKKQIQVAPAATTRRRQSYFRWFLAALLIAFLILTTLAKTIPYFSFDLVITRTIQSFRPVWFELFMKAVSSMGEVGPQLAIPFLTALAMWFFKLKKEALVLTMSTYGAIAISETVKIIVARPRPDGTLIIQVGHFVRHDSFPSGHVLFYMGFFGFLLYLSYSRLKKTWLQRFLVVFFSGLLILVGISRIYLGAHWFSDTLGSYLIGTAWLLLIVQLQRYIKNWGILQ